MNQFDPSSPSFQGVCPKTGKPIVRPRLSGWAQWLFPLIGLLSLVWFLIRVLPKPSRAAYPCQRAAAPLASSFVLWLLSMGGCTLAFRHARQKMFKARFAIGGLLFVLGVGAALFAVVGGPNGLAHAVVFGSGSGTTYEDGPYYTIENPNTPVGVGQGIHPGRVAWVYDPTATMYGVNSSNITWQTNTNDDDPTDAGGLYYWDNQHCNQAEVNAMMPKAVCYMTGDSNPATAWNDIFRYFNRNHNKGDIGYTPGEKIGIKINGSALLNFNSPLLDSNQTGHGNDDRGYLPVNPSADNTSLYTLSSNDSDPTPQAIIALLNQLVNVAGVPQQDIYIGDPIRPFTDYLYKPCHAAFPYVNYVDSLGQAGRVLSTYTNPPCLFYSNHPPECINGVWEPGVEMTDQMPDYIYNADYFINMPLLKRETGDVGLTVCGKNTFGMMNRSPAHVHDWCLPGSYSVPGTSLSWSTGWGTYNVLVDHLGSKNIGGKTLLNVVDGLFGGWTSNGETSMPQKWSTLPQGGQAWWPSTLLVSQDVIAVDSVALDFLIGEVTQGGKVWLGNCADNYLIEGAQANNPPSGTFYDPDRSGTRLQSLGVHEHWNDDVHRQYSRNLGIGQGIELVSSPTTTVSVSPATIAGGQSGTVNIVMNAQGTESAVGFSLNFDPTQLQFVSAQLGADASGAYLVTNTTNAASGQLGFGIAAQPLGSGVTTFPSGSLTILQVTFQAVGSGPTTAVTFGDTPVIRQITDVDASTLPSSFTTGTVTLSALAPGASMDLAAPVNFTPMCRFTTDSSLWSSSSGGFSPPPEDWFSSPSQGNFFDLFMWYGWGVYSDTTPHTFNMMCTTYTGNSGNEPIRRFRFPSGATSPLPPWRRSPAGA